MNFFIFAVKRTRFYTTKYLHSRKYNRYNAVVFYRGRTFSAVYKTVSRYIFESENKIVGLSDDGRIATWPRGIGQPVFHLWRKIDVKWISKKKIFFFFILPTETSCPYQRSIFKRKYIDFSRRIIAHINKYFSIYLYSSQTVYSILPIVTQFLDYVRLIIRLKYIYKCKRVTLG